MTEKIESIATRLSVADVSSAIAFGLQRAVKQHDIADKILIYGGRLDFNIQIHPLASGGIKEITNIEQG